MAVRKEEVRREEAYLEWHMRTAEEVLEDLKTSVDGLTEDEVEVRLEKFGPNKLAEEEKTPILVTVLHQFQDPLIYILLIAGVITILLQDYIDAAVIFAVVVLNAVIGFIQEYKAEESIRALRKLLALKTTVIRDGFEREFDAEMIVPGDIVLLQSGQKIPADLRLVYEKELQVDESAFTGESTPVSKMVEPIPEPNLQPFEKKNMVFMGEVVASGRATGIVVATGNATQLGQISEAVRSVGTVKTPLQGRVEVLTRYIIYAVIIFGLIGLIAGVARGESLLLLFLTIIAMAVSAIPEGLPVALTIALAVAVNRMAKRNAIIRYLPAIETLGSSTAIGSDKTGTLTRNEMTVQRIWAGGKTYRVEGLGYEPMGHILSNSNPVDIKSDVLLEWTLRIGLLANESNLVQEDHRWTVHGDPTEVALIVSTYRGGMDEEKEKYEYPQLDILPFESELQYMATLNEYKGKAYLLVKGAPEKLLLFSKSVAGAQESIEMDKTAVIEKENEFADQGLRVLGMAYKEMPTGTDEITHDDVNDLNFVGIQGMMDPPRPEAIEAVASAKLSGIRVIMITGDNERTALSIARMMGIAQDGTAMTGRELDELSDDELRETIQTTS
ncbi:MAG TPA: HAD-IC family P-type ATPase, partial [Anaerolineae bacterium]|nr:HAD-IC family P-type ATPase [Anaerolineae bacterium]